MRRLLLCLWALRRAYVPCSMLLLSSAALVTPAWAQDQPAPRERREAKRLFDQAHLAYRRGDYEEAILKWQQSYELSKEPLIFESIANAYERLGDLEAAHKYLSQWRAHAPKNEQKELDSRLESLKARLDEKRASDEKLREEEERKRRAQEEQRQRDEEARRREAEERDLGSQSSEMWIAGWTLTGVGAGAVIAGVIVDAVAFARRPDEDEACRQPNGCTLCDKDERDDIESSNTLAIAGDITWISGAVIAAGGVALIVVSTQTQEEDAALRFELVPGLGAITLRTRF